MPVPLRNLLPYGVQNKTDVGRVARVISARQAVGKARATTKMCDGYDPASCPEVRGDRLSVTAAAVAFKPMKK